jgi:hypothetical protein
MPKVSLCVRLVNGDTYMTLPIAGIITVLFFTLWLFALLRAARGNPKSK